MKLPAVMMDHQKMEAELNARGYAILPRLVTPQFCQAMIDGYADHSRYRKTINMARYRFGSGEYRYFATPLPQALVDLRTTLYPLVQPTANRWMQLLREPIHFPESHDAFLTQCHNKDQYKPTPLILKYGEGDFNTLHQDLYGEIYFPLQVVIMLSALKDYEGGELVFNEQVPRAQSKAMVVRPEQGDAVVFTTRFRPQLGKRGYYRVNMKHGVSEVKRGSRYTLGIIFHDAA